MRRFESGSSGRWRIDGYAPHLAEALGYLDPRPDDLAQARQRVLDLLPASDRRDSLKVALARLAPTATDLMGWASWPDTPYAELIVVTRQNSRIESWLELLPALEGISFPGKGI